MELTSMQNTCNYLLFILFMYSIDKLISYSLAMSWTEILELKSPVTKVSLLSLCFL